MISEIIRTRDFYLILWNEGVRGIPVLEGAQTGETEGGRAAGEGERQVTGKVEPVIANLTVHGFKLFLYFYRVM